MPGRLALLSPFADAAQSGTHVLHDVSTVFRNLRGDGCTEHAEVEELFARIFASRLVDEKLELREAKISSLFKRQPPLDACRRYEARDCDTESIAVVSTESSFVVNPGFSTSSRARRRRSQGDKKGRLISCPFSAIALKLSSLSRSDQPFSRLQ
jgi:hypothetical protein